MREFNVTGMSCAACSARVEKAVSAVDGVDMVAVNLLTNSMVVEGSAENSVIINAVVKAGYGASEKSQQSEKSTKSEELKLYLVIFRALLSLFSKKMTFGVQFRSFCFIAFRNRCYAKWCNRSCLTRIRMADWLFL